MTVRAEFFCHGARSLRIVAAALLAALFFAPAVHAEDPWSFKWSNGFKLESPDKNFSLKFGGRIMADYTFASAEDIVASEDGFEFRRARLFFEGEVYERVEFKAQYDFAGGEAAFKDVYVGIVNDWGSLRFGHFHEPFSIEELTSSKYITFLERSLPIEAFSPSRNSGVGALGSTGDHFNWGFGAYYEADDFGIDESEDRINITGRVVFRPLYEDKGERLFHVGLSATQKDRGDNDTFRFRTRPEVHDIGRTVDTGSFPADSATIFDVELAGVFGPFWFLSEYLQNDVDAPLVGDPTFDGFYVQAGYFLTGEHRAYKTSNGTFDRLKPKENFGKGGGAWEIAVRYSTVDLTDEGIFGGEQEDLSLAVNWYLNPVTRLMFNYITADVDGVGDGDFITVRWSFDF